MSDLERFVNQSGRDQKVKEVRKLIDELGITYIYYQFISVTGRVMGKGAPAAHWERMAENGFQLVYGSTANLFIDRRGDYIGYPASAWELVGIPEPETFMQLPWDKRIARVFCTCFRGREHEENPGAYLTSDSRADNIRPIAASGEDGGAVVWLRGRYTAYTDYDLEVVGIPWTSGGE